MSVRDVLENLLAIVDFGCRVAHDGDNEGKQVWGGFARPTQLYERKSERAKIPEMEFNEISRVCKYNNIANMPSHKGANGEWEWRCRESMSRMSSSMHTGNFYEVCVTVCIPVRLFVY